MLHLAHVLMAYGVIDSHTTIWAEYADQSSSIMQPGIITDQASRELRKIHRKPELPPLPPAKKKNENCECTNSDCVELSDAYCAALYEIGELAEENSLLKRKLEEESSACKKRCLQLVDCQKEKDAAEAAYKNLQKRYNKQVSDQESILVKRNKVNEVREDNMRAEITEKVKLATDHFLAEQHSNAIGTNAFIVSNNQLRKTLFILYRSKES